MHWRDIQKSNYRCMEELFHFLEMEPSKRQAFEFDSPFPLNLPRRLADKIAKNSLSDPILRQFVPLQEENAPTPTFTADPLEESRFHQGEKLLHKYQGRALLLTTSECAMNCRFCFRRHFPYEKKRRGYDAELQTLTQTPSIQEVILSGGDPLSLSDNALEALLTTLGSIPHVQRIRFHTRFPLGIPERISPAFLHLLQNCPKQLLFVLHINHPSELDTDIYLALNRLQKLGLPLLSQTVLLRGINDDPATLQTLFEDLVNHGILPYYLHSLDKVQGAAHFEVPTSTGKHLIATLRTHLSGYAIPTFVQELPGEPSKTPL